VVRDYVYVVRDGVGAEDGSWCGAGWVGAAECGAAEGCCACDDETGGSGDACAFACYNCAGGVAAGKFFAGESAAAECAVNAFEQACGAGSCVYSGS
jgi:hypothetical protein